ncbi:MAG: cyclic nucleotide-binding domain-containing protein [bacterium]|nr:cyclic nucleotide-binding domain-containing protein [bacterium]
MQSVENALAKVSFFSTLSQKTLRKLANLCVPREFPADSLMLQDGTTGLGLFLITSGRVEVFKTEDERRISLAILGEGDILGEMALVDDQPRSASAVTLEPTTSLLLTRDSFRTLVKKNPEVAWAIVPSLAERLRDLQNRLLEAEARAGGAPAARPPAAEPAKEPRPAVRAKKRVKREATTPARTTDLWLQFLRMQFGVLRSGATGISGSAKMFESFLRSLADETDLDRSRHVDEVLRKLPRGALSAGESSWDEGRKIPERMISSFLFHFKKNRSTRG